MNAEEKGPIVEICCGSFYDAIQAAKGGAKRIELNSALMLGGLTPSTATLKLIKQNLPDLKVITMVRPRGAGFCYSDEEFQVMEAECRELLEAGADGIAFGCLTADRTLDIEKNSRLLSLMKEYNKEAVVVTVQPSSGLLQMEVQNLCGMHKMEEIYEKRKCEGTVAYWGIFGALFGAWNLVRVCYGNSYGIL